MNYGEDGLFLLNRELVLSEILSLARLKISGILKVMPEAINVYCEVEDGKLHPCIDIHPDAVAGVTAVQVREVVSSIYDKLRMDLRVRLGAIGRKRESYLPDDEEEADDDSNDATAGQA